MNSRVHLGGGFSMSSYVQQAGLLSGRQMTLAAVIGLHVLVIGGLITARMVPIIINTDKRIDVIPVVDVKPPDPAPRELKLEPHKVTQTVIQMPDVIIEDFQSPSTQTLQAVSAQPGSEVGSTDVDQGSSGTVVAPPRVVTELQFRITRPTEDYYPPASIAMEEQGVSIVRVCVDAVGRINGQPTIQTTSGSKRLDQAAIRWARESLRFTPATENGAGVPACKGFRVNFNLH
jgi:periplasmic protein TonB